MPFWTSFYTSVSSQSEEWIDSITFAKAVASGNILSASFEWSFSGLNNGVSDILETLNGAGRQIRIVVEGYREKDDYETLGIP